MIVIFCIIILLLASTPSSFAQNTTIDSFNHAKKLLTQGFAGNETEVEALNEPHRQVEGAFAEQRCVGAHAECQREHGQTADCSALSQLA